MATLVELLAERDLLLIAPNHQGGHSDKGQVIADRLGVPFPLSMPDLRKFAAARGYEPYDLWPWLERLDSQAARARGGEAMRPTPGREDEDGLATD